MTVNGDDEYQIKKQAERIVNENLIMLLEDSNQEKSTPVNNSSVNNVTDDLPVYFRWGFNFNFVEPDSIGILSFYFFKETQMFHVWMLC